MDITGSIRKGKHLKKIILCASFKKGSFINLIIERVEESGKVCMENNFFIVKFT